MRLEPHPYIGVPMSRMRRGKATRPALGHDPAHICRSRAHAIGCLQRGDGPYDAPQRDDTRSGTLRRLTVRPHPALQRDATAGIPSLW
jgi:hypothetical protein